MGQFASVIPYDYGLETHACRAKVGAKPQSHGVLLPWDKEIATMLSGRPLVPPPGANKANCP